MAAKCSLSRLLQTVAFIVVFCASFQHRVYAQTGQCCNCEQVQVGQPEVCNCPPTKTDNGACVCDELTLPGGVMECIKCGTCEPPFGCISCSKKCILCGTLNPGDSLLDDQNAEIPLDLTQHPWMTSRDLIAKVQSHAGAVTVAKVVEVSQVRYSKQKTITSCMSFSTGSVSIRNPQRENWWDVTHFRIDRIGNAWSFVLTDLPAPPDNVDDAITRLEVSGTSWKMYHGMKAVDQGVFGK